MQLRGDVSNIFLHKGMIFAMKKIKMARGVTLAFEEGYEKYLEYCRQRNLREGTTERKTDRSITA